MANNDGFFGGAAGLSWSLEQPDGSYVDNPATKGVPRGGYIVDEPIKQQQTKMADGTPLWWQEPDPSTGFKGRPMEELVVTLRCDGSGTGPGVDERNASDPSDNGDRRCYIRGVEMVNAVRGAFKKVGKGGIEIGGELYVAWTGYRPAKTKGFHAARTWAAMYVAPVHDVGFEDGSPFGAQPESAPPTQETTNQGQNFSGGDPFGGGGQQQAQQNGNAQQSQSANPFGGGGQATAAPVGGNAPNPFG